MTRSSLRRQFEEEPKLPKYDPDAEEKKFKSAWLYGNILVCLVVVFMCIASVNWMNSDITGEYVSMMPDALINEKNFPDNRYWQNTETDPKRRQLRQRVINSLKEVRDRQGATDDSIRLSLTRGPLTMYGDLTVNSVQMNLLNNEAPRTSSIDLVFETSEYDVKLGHPKKRCFIKGELKDGAISGNMQIGKDTRRVKFVRDGMASIQKRIQQSPLFGHWRWPWEQSS